MATIGARYAAAAAAFPGVQLTQEAFGQAWKARSVAPLDESRASDVFLAAAIEAGDAVAVGWLKSQIRRALLSMSRPVPQQLFDDVESEVLTLISVGSEGRAARIGDYAALGPLAAWVHAVVARTAGAMATRLGRGEQASFELLVLRELDEASPSTPELELLRGRLRPHLVPALQAAAAGLEKRARSLLALHYLDGVGLEELARAYQVHRTTVSRWLVFARDAFLERARDELANRANIGRLDVDSAMRALNSQLDLNLRRALDSKVSSSL